MDKEDKYPSFDFHSSKIREHIKIQPDYESAVEYLDHVDAQYEFIHWIFIMNIFREMGLRKYLSLDDGFYDCEPLPESKRREKILEKAARFAMSELGFYDINLLDEKEIVEITKNKIVKEWIAYDEETKAWYFLLPKVAESIRLNFKRERRGVDWLMHRGRLLHRDEGSASSQSTAQNKTNQASISQNVTIIELPELFVWLKDLASLTQFLEGLRSTKFLLSDAESAREHFVVESISGNPNEPIIWNGQRTFAIDVLFETCAAFDFMPKPSNKEKAATEHFVIYDKKKNETRPPRNLSKSVIQGKASSKYSEYYKIIKHLLESLTK